MVFYNVNLYKLKPEQVAAIIEKYNIKLDQLPHILHTDYAVKQYNLKHKEGLKVGDLVYESEIFTPFDTPRYVI